MNDFNTFLLIFVGIQALICYLCFITKEAVIFSDTQGLIPVLFFLVFALIPIIPSIIFTYKIIKHHILVNKKKKVLYQMMNVKTDEELVEKLTDATMDQINKQRGEEGKK